MQLPRELQNHKREFLILLAVAVSAFILAASTFFWLVRTSDPGDQPQTGGMPTSYHLDVSEQPAA